MLKRLNISSFRQFDNKELLVGKKLTVVSGQNATGKSQILGLIANSCEYKIGDGKPILQSQFRAEWSEIFKGSKRHDLHASNILSVTYELEGSDYDIHFRTTWQTDSNGDDRFRIIPKRMRRPEDNGYGVKSDITEAKLKYPVLYLGLSRLFPLGESSSSIDNHQIGMTDDEDIWFKNAYKAIVKSDVQITSVESLKFLETNKSLHAGINTDAYDIIGNSSGQNNISQILLALLSFRRISENTNYVGGLLLIDEFEATIHPSVQSNMLKFILETCHSLRLQVVLTTHSTSIFDFVHSKTKRNDPNRQNDIEFYYLSNSNGGLSIRRNPNPSAVYSDMHNISSILDSSFRRLTIYSEDDEARWMIRKLFSQYMHYIQLIEINVGSDELIKFDMSDPEYFSRVMIILDGDKGIDLSLSRNINKLLLPGNVRPEQVIYDYILSLNNDHEYFERYFGLVSKEIIRSSGPFSDLYNNLSEERDKFKKWFNDNLQLFEQTLIMDYWMNENQQEYSILLDQFKLKYNILASKNSLRRII